MKIGTKTLPDYRQRIPQIWELTLLLYLLRSIAEPLKYVFIISFGILLFSYTFFLILKFRNNTIFRYFWVTREFHILSIFLLVGILFSDQIQILPVKSFTNYLGIAFLFLVYFEYKDYIQLSRLLKRWMLFTLAIGIFGLFKWLNFIFGLELGLFSGFYGPGTSLVSEYNFFASYFIVSIVIYLYGLYSNAIHKRLLINQAILLCMIIIIALSGSRRGIILLGIFAILAISFLLFRRDKKSEQLYRNLLSMNILLLIILAVVLALIPFRTKLIHKESTRKNIATSIYRYTTLLNPNSNYFIFYEKVWPKSAAYKDDNTQWDEFASYNNLVKGAIINRYQDLKSVYWLDFEPENQTKNLFYNGDFKFGTKFWRIYAKAHIRHDIISTEYGNAIRVSRSDGSGNWSLEYDGRELVYYEGLTYTFRFKFRVVQGKGVPFKIGWWVDEGEGPVNDLEYSIKPLGAGWFEYTASYTFKNDQRNLLTFMNYQQKNTIIDFTDIELKTDDPHNRPSFLDQVLQIDGENLFYNSNFQHGLKFWGSVTRDSIIHRIVDSPYGKAIRVSRNEGKGMWPLAYRGREIYYHKDINYHFRFKFRVVKGAGIPFKIGWRAMEVKPIPYNLHMDIFPISDQWFECITSYRFDRDQYGEILTFLNNQEANTIIELTDIELLCDDTLNRRMYSDELIREIHDYEELRLIEQLGTENQKLLAERVERWKYACELWMGYAWYNKLLGDGFDYLDQFGQKFYPGEEKADYPHNPMISSFLYSGIIGGLFYLYFLTLSIWHYWKYRKHHMLFLIIYAIYFIFILISGDNHFSVPVFAMLSLVPFMTRFRVKEKELKKQNKF